MSNKNTFGGINDTFNGTRNILCIPRKEVENLRIKSIMDFLGVALKDGSNNTYQISFDGYNDDPRPVGHIPEIRNFMAKADKKFNGCWLNIRWDDSNQYPIILSTLLEPILGKLDELQCQLMGDIITRHAKQVVSINLCRVRDSLCNILSSEGIDAMLNSFDSKKANKNYVCHNFYVQGHEVLMHVYLSDKSPQFRCEWNPVPKKISHRFKVEYRKKRNEVLTNIAKEINGTVLMIDTLDKKTLFTSVSPDGEIVCEYR